MANVKVIFYDSREGEKIELNCSATLRDEICVSIQDKSCYHDYNIQEIKLDKPTAVRLVRELKKQIGLLISDKEVSNG